MVCQKISNTFISHSANNKLLAFLEGTKQFPSFIENAKNYINYADLK